MKTLCLMKDKKKQSRRAEPREWGRRCRPAGAPPSARRGRSLQPEPAAAGRGGQDVGCASPRREAERCRQPEASVGGSFLPPQHMLRCRERRPKPAG